MEHEVAAGQPAQKKQRRSQNKGGLPYTLHKDGSNDPYECNCCHTRFTYAMMRKHVKATAAFASANPSATPLAACQHALSVNKDERGKTKGQKGVGTSAAGTATAAAAAAARDDEDDEGGQNQGSDDDSNPDADPQPPPVPIPLPFAVGNDDGDDDELPGLQEDQDPEAADPFLAAILIENEEGGEQEEGEDVEEEEEDIPTQINLLNAEELERFAGLFLDDEDEQDVLEADALGPIDEAQWDKLVGPSSTVTLKQYCYQLLKLRHEGKIRDGAMDKVIKMDLKLLGPNNIAPRSFHMLKKFLGVESSDKYEYQVCKNETCIFPQPCGGQKEYKILQSDSCMCGCPRFKVEKGGRLVPWGRFWDLGIGSIIGEMMQDNQFTALTPWVPKDEGWWISEEAKRIDALLPDGFKLNSGLYLPIDLAADFGQMFMWRQHSSGLLSIRFAGLPTADRNKDKFISRAICSSLDIWGGFSFQGLGYGENKGEPLCLGLAAINDRWS